MRRALAALFGGAVGKDTVGRVWRKVKGDWGAWNARSLEDEPIIRLILHCTIVRVRLDKKATSIRFAWRWASGKPAGRILLAVKNMGGESEPPGGRSSTISSNAALRRRNLSPELCMGIFLSSRFRRCRHPFVRP